MVAACCARPAAIADPPHGVLSQGSMHSHPTPEFRGFLERLRELGWIENQSLLIEWRFSEGSAAPLARLATELVENNVEVIVTTPTQPRLRRSMPLPPSPSYLWGLPIHYCPAS